jgi:hypothetical protein
MADARYRDDRLAGLDRKDTRGKAAPKPRSPNPVRLDLASLGHLYNVAIKEWGIGLSFNPAQSIRHPAPSPGRDRRLTRDLNADRDVDLELEHIEKLTAIIQKHTERVATLLDASLARWLICPPDIQMGAAAQASGGKVP